MSRSIRSSWGMKTNDMNRKKPTGATSIGHEPSHSGIPDSMATMPRYMGLRENRNGPDVTRDEAWSVGRIGVPLRRKSHHAQIISRKPDASRTRPQTRQEKSP